MAPEPQDGAAPSVDHLVAQLKERVEERRRAGDYPAGLEDSLDLHFQRIALHRAPSYDFEALRGRLSELERTAFSPERISYDTELPGGTALHRLVARLVSRQTSGILEQMQAFADALRGVLNEIIDILEDPKAHLHPDLTGQLDVVLERLAAYEQGPSEDGTAVRALRRKVEDLEALQARSNFKPWYSNERFEEAFRGQGDDLAGRYRGLASRFQGCSPVVDLGCGRGEFIELLQEIGVDASGVEIDMELVRYDQRKGLDVVYGDAVAWLADCDDGTLGGLSLIQVVEHLTPQDLADLVPLVARKLRPGGKVVVETVNPQSLYTFAHSFYLDPTHYAPVHPAYLLFLFEEAGFEGVEIEWRSPCPPDDVLEQADGDDPIVKRFNANADRLNRLLFAEQDYALIAVR